MISLKQKIRDKHITIGSWVTINHPSIAEIMCNSGFDWLVIDAEHSSFDNEDIKNMMVAIQANQTKGFVRVAKNDEVIIKRVLDLGADGIIVPMINNVVDVKNAINSIYYPPKGKRGVGLNRAQGYGQKLDKYIEWLNRECIFCIQIEHIDAINNLEEILEFDEIDALLIGPYDLSASLGFPGQYDKKEVKDALEKFKFLCKKKNKTYGFHVVPSDYNMINSKIHEGYTFLGFSLDFIFLSEKITSEMKNIKKEIK